MSLPMPPTNPLPSSLSMVVKDSGARVSETPTRISRLIHQVRARLGGYFWLPCPVCGEDFGGHEKPAGSLWRHGLIGGASTGRMYCPRCVAKYGPSITLTSLEFDTCRLFKLPVELVVPLVDGPEYSKRGSDAVQFFERGYLNDWVAESVPPCPECAAGKHTNCDGRSWDNQADAHVPCPCADAGHDPGRDQE